MNDGVKRQTSYHLIRLPRVEQFACTKKDIKNAFGTDVLDWVSLGFIKHFTFDRRVHPRPNIKGRILASLTIDPENESYLCLYSFRKESYSEEAAQAFREQVIPEMRSWLDRKTKRTKTAILGYEELIVEWDTKKHLTHEIRHIK